MKRLNVLSSIVWRSGLGGVTYYTATIPHYGATNGAFSFCASSTNNMAGGASSQASGGDSEVESGGKSRSSVSHPAVGKVKGSKTTPSSIDIPPDKLSLEKALADMKEASRAMGGTLRGEEALALMALLARETVHRQTNTHRDSKIGRAHV